MDKLFKIRIPCSYYTKDTFVYVKNYLMTHNDFLTKKDVVALLKEEHRRELLDKSNIHNYNGEWLEMVDSVNQLKDEELITPFSEYVEIEPFGKLPIEIEEIKYSRVLVDIPPIY